MTSIIGWVIYEAFFESEAQKNLQFSPNFKGVLFTQLSNISFGNIKCLKISLLVMIVVKYRKIQATIMKRQNIQNLNIQEHIVIVEDATHCHPEQPKLTEEEIQIIKLKAKQNKNIKPKRYDKGCQYCLKIAEKINQQRYQQAKSLREEEENNKTKNILINESKNTIENAPFIKRVASNKPNKLQLQIKETTGDGNCDIYAILQCLNLSTTFLEISLLT